MVFLVGLISFSRAFPFHRGRHTLFSRSWRYIGLSYVKADDGLEPEWLAPSLFSTIQGTKRLKTSGLSPCPDRCLGVLALLTYVVMKNEIQCMHTFGLELGIKMRCGRNGRHDRISSGLHHSLCDFMALFQKHRKV